LGLALCLAYCGGLFRSPLDVGCALFVFLSLSLSLSFWLWYMHCVAVGLCFVLLLTLSILVLSDCMCYTPIISHSSVMCSSCYLSSLSINTCLSLSLSPPPSLPSFPFFPPSFPLLLATLGAGAAFLLGRFLVRDWVAEKVKNNAIFHSVDLAIGRQGWLIVLLIRLSPVIPFNLINYALALTRIPFLVYLFVRLACVACVYVIECT
jgi:VTT domain